MENLFLLLFRCDERKVSVKKGINLYIVKVLGFFEGSLIFAEEVDREFL